MKLKNTPLAAVIASMAMVASSQAAITTIATDNFNIGTTQPNPDLWATNYSVSAGQWTLAQSVTNPAGRVVAGDPHGDYGGTTNEGTGRAQFSNGAQSGYSATITDTVGHYFNVGDQVSINYFSAARNAGDTTISYTISLVGAATLGYGTFAPASTTWTEANTSFVTINTAGNYNVQFATAGPDGTDRTSYLDSVSYKVDAIPEPSAALLGGLGMLCLLRRRR